MTPAVPRRSAEETARLGQEIYERRVRPLLAPEDDGKYVAIDIVSEEYEVGDTDWNAIERVIARRRGAEIWVARVNKPYRLSYRMRFPQ